MKVGDWVTGKEVELVFGKILSSYEDMIFTDKFEIYAPHDFRKKKPFELVWVCLKARKGKPKKVWHMNVEEDRNQEKAKS
jgi:hypothetical protein